MGDARAGLVVSLVERALVVWLAFIDGCYRHSNPKRKRGGAGRRYIPRLRFALSMPPLARIQLSEPDH